MSVLLSLSIGYSFSVPSHAKIQIAYGASLLFVYSLGRGVPVILAGTFTGALKSLQKLKSWSDGIEKVSGVIVIAVGLYFLWIA